MKIHLVVGARPNFVKAAAILKAAEKYPEVDIQLIHTGQHRNIMSDPFFRDLELPRPSFHFNDFPEMPPDVCTAERLGFMTAFLGRVFEGGRPDYVMVVGDTDSTLAGALAALKTDRRLIHVEAGLRSYTVMQEESNRRLVDTISQLMYTTTRDASATLFNEGHDPADVVFVGNVMIDTLLRFKSKWTKWERCPEDTGYAVLTLHRAETVDDPATLAEIMSAVEEIAKEIHVIFPAHPRVVKLLSPIKNVTVVAPRSYIDFINLMYRSNFVMTDSGGVQEETTGMGIPCVTIRNVTERPETIDRGSNVLSSNSRRGIIAAARVLLDQQTRPVYPIPNRWDGHAADRLMQDLVAR